MSQKKKLLIGIPGFTNSDKMFGVTGNYMHFANKYGNVRIIMPHEEFVEVDLLILPGGLDLSPGSYGKIPGYQTSNHDVFKEYFFKNRLATYVEKGTPIFGICLGFQMINAFFGGTLTQHLPFHPQSRNRWEAAHEVILTQQYIQYLKKHPKPKTKEEKKNIPTIEVNSHHHQAVCITTNDANEIIKSDLAKDFYMVAHYPESYDTNVVEAFKHETLPIAGVQFHPEEFFDVISDQLIRSILPKEVEEPKEQLEVQ